MGSDGPSATKMLLGGGIGAGKSAVADLFVQAGFLLIEADRIGAEVLRPHTEATRAVAEIWPEAVRDGVVDREVLARIVFSDDAELRRLEAVTHPAITAEIERRVADVRGNIIVEVPLTHLVLSGDWTKVVVVADEEIRIDRAVGRGGDPADVRRRVSSQVPDHEWVAWADIVIDNNDTWSATERTVQAVIREVRK